MNKKRKESIKDQITSLRNAQRNLEDILREEENTYDNMPENLQCSLRGMDSEDAIDILTEVIETLTEIIDSLEDI